MSNSNRRGILIPGGCALRYQKWLNSVVGVAWKRVLHSASLESKFRGYIE